MSKLVKDMKEAIRLSGLKDGMTISFHHHLRNGDMVAVMVLDAMPAARATSFCDISHCAKRTRKL